MDSEDSWTSEDVTENPRIGKYKIGIKDEHGQRIAEFDVNFINQDWDDFRKTYQNQHPLSRK